MTYDDKIYKKLKANYGFLCNILRQPSSDFRMKVDLSKIEDIINKRIPDTLKRNAPEDFYELYTDFKSEYEKFRYFILYDKLIGKNIIALGGGFSSGKSSFLNALMKQHPLPENIAPSTAVPTYIVYGPEYETTGINIFNSKITMSDFRDIKRIAHNFGEIKNEDNEIVISSDVTLGHILESVFLTTPKHAYKNIAFLDTPGYSNTDSENYSAKTDEQVSRGQLNSSNYILWFVQADRGTITEEDVKFIKTLREDIPKLIIVNKADTKILSDLENIIAKIKLTLETKGIRYVDVFPFTSRLDLLEDYELREFIETGIDAIKKQLQFWDSQMYESNFARNFKILFVRCKKYYEEEIDEERRKLVRLNPFLTMAADIDGAMVEPLQNMRDEAQKNINELKAMAQKLKELQDEFFSEIKLISDIVGIAMPEPSEIDLLQDKIKKPMQQIEEYKRETGSQTDPSIVAMLQSVLGGIEPAINKHAGGSEYCDELIDVIKELCDIQPDDIHINDVFMNTLRWQKHIT